jgi:hypothetical protein
MEEVFGATAFHPARDGDRTQDAVHSPDIGELGNSPDDVEARLRESAATPLWAWRVEAMLPWADVPLMRSLVEAQIGTLTGFLNQARPDRRPRIKALIAKYRAFLAELKPRH